MTRRRFFVPSDAIQNDIARLPEDQSHHLRDVLRIDEGETVEIFDGEGLGYTGTGAFHNSEVTVRHLEKLPSMEPDLPLVLAAALIKPSKFEWMLQKATELGVCEIIPIQTRRGEIRMPQIKTDQKRNRWTRIVQEASKQCGRHAFPRIRHSVDYMDLLYHEEFADFSRLAFYERADELWRPEMLKPRANGVLLFVGPEGGWETGEIDAAVAAGVRIASLGPWTLRAETASIAAVSIIQHHIHLLARISDRNNS
ncbi:MAG: RsmE family RNA methyltransferase [Acidobacteriota bacterium]